MKITTQKTIRGQFWASHPDLEAHALPCNANAAIQYTDKMKTTITKTAAIKHARKNVSSLSVFGDGYKFSTYDVGMHAWRDSRPRQYHSAQLARSQALIDAARDFLDLPCVEYDGGAWVDYV